MNCTICGKATMPGAMLCGPCKAALKRARYVTVQDDIRRSSIIDVRRRPRRASRPAAAAVATSALPPAPAKRAYPLRPLFIGIAAMAVLGTIAYFGQQEPSAQAHDAMVLAPLPTSLVPGEVSMQTKPAAVDVVPPSVAPAETSSAVAEAAPHSDPTKTTPPGGGKRAPPRTSATFATVNGDPPDATPPPLPVPEKVAAVPVAPPPPPAPDRWQSMRDSIALCDRENLINGIICGQKARIQYCEGYWGKVPQCPGPTANPDR